MKSIFITGAASGIGKETALLFARNGWFVGLYDLNEDGVKQLSNEIGLDKSCFGQLDVTDAEMYAKAVEYFVTRTDGKMDAIFNCAGIMYMGPFHKLSLAQHKRTYDINVMGVINGIYVSLDALKKAGKSTVVSMSSASAFYGVPDLASYSSSKFAVRGLTEALNIEFEQYGIQVTDLMPLYVNTPMVSSQSYQAASLKTFGSNLTPQMIAGIVWKAVNGNKVHWVPTFKLKFLTMLSRFFPFAERATMKTLGM